MIGVECEERYDREGVCHVFRIDQTYGGNRYTIDSKAVTLWTYQKEKMGTKSSMELNALRYIWIRDQATGDELDRMIVLASRDVDAYVDARLRPWGE